MPRRFLLGLLLFAAVQFGQVRAVAEAGRSGDGVPILLYHRFGPTVADSMTVTTAVFAEQVEWLAAHGYSVVPLHRLVESLVDPSVALPPRAVAIVADDGHRSVYTDMWPVIRRMRLPVTLFIYPSAISNASYALTWAQIAEMKASGLVDIQSHTYWHPNFNSERKKLAPDAYRAFVLSQLDKSKRVLEQRGGAVVDMLAWPFGIHDPQLEALARQAGYRAAFTLDRRPVGPDSDLMALPRYLMTDRDRGSRFEAIVEGRGR